MQSVMLQNMCLEVCFQFLLNGLDFFKPILIFYTKSESNDAIIIIGDSLKKQMYFRGKKSFFEYYKLM